MISTFFPLTTKTLSQIIWKNFLLFSLLLIPKVYPPCASKLSSKPLRYNEKGKELQKQFDQNSYLKE